MPGVQVRVLDNNRIAVRGASRRDFGVGLTVDYDERVPDFAARIRAKLVG